MMEPMTETDDHSNAGRAAAEPNPDTIRAAGCLVYRMGDGGIEVLVAHRPRYDDWDFPKGKLDPGETELECALRETAEETGYTGELGPELPIDHYEVPGRKGGPARPKTVRWWLLRQTGGGFEANDEVDEIRWLRPEAAREILSYGHAARLLDLLPELVGPDGRITAEAGPEQGSNDGGSSNG